MNFKDMVLRGIYYLGAGHADYPAWSEDMLVYYGSEIKPHIKDIRKWSIVIQNPYVARQCSKLNCWQFMGCLLQKSEGLCGDKVESYRCPALSVEKLDGIHDGINGGRVCWIVSHTFCCGATQGTYEEKYQDCCCCDFYRLVSEEEENDFKGLHELEKLLV